MWALVFGTIEISSLLCRVLVIRNLGRTVSFSLVVVTLWTVLLPPSASCAESRGDRSCLFRWNR